MTGGRAHEEYDGTKRTSVPFGTSYFPAEIFWLPKSYVYIFCSFSTNTLRGISDVLWFASADGCARLGTWCSRPYTPRAGTSQRSSNPRPSLAICARRLAEAGPRTV